MSVILDDIKQVLGVHKDAKEFDIDIVMAANSAFFNLMQIGVGPVGGFEISAEGDEKWVDFLGSRKDLNAVKSYVFIVARLLFDRPESSYGIQSLERMRDEWAWRLEVQRRSEE